MSRFAPVFACCVLLLVPAGVAADIYRYVDSRGIEHYTNIQPRGTGWQRIYRSHQSARTHAHEPVVPRHSGTQRTSDPGRYNRYDDHLREAASLYKLPEPFLRAVARVESDFQPYAVSEDGAMGIMQLMPATARSMGVVDAFEPRQNVLGGARFLRTLANRFGGDLVLTLASYNAGPGAVEKHRGVPPYRETRRYVMRVLQHYYAYVDAERQHASK